jgi:hypothetical protein
MRITIDAAPREQHGECDDDCEMDQRGEEERGLHVPPARQSLARLRNALLGKSREDSKLADRRTLKRKEVSK